MPVKSFRRQQLDELIRTELSIIMAREIEFPAGSIATITRVIVDGEMKHARVNFTVIPAAQTTEAFIVLKRHRRVLQRLLIKRLSMQRIPDILFEIDTGADEALERDDANIDTLLAQVAREVKAYDKEQKELETEHSEE